MTQKRLTGAEKAERFLRTNGGRCFYCRVALHVDSVTRDHFIPKSRGGKGRTNLVPCCIECNRDKGNRIPSDTLIVKWAKVFKPTEQALGFVLRVVARSRPISGYLRLSITKKYPDVVWPGIGRWDNSKKPKLEKDPDRDDIWKGGKRG